MSGKFFYGNDTPFFVVLVFLNAHVFLQYQNFKKNIILLCFLCTDSLQLDFFTWIILRQIVFLKWRSLTKNGLFSFERCFPLVGVVVLFSHYFLQVDTYLFSINKIKIKSINEYTANTLFKSQIPVSCCLQFYKKKTAHCPLHIMKYPHISSIHVQWRSSVTTISCYLYMYNIVFTQG